MKEALLINIMWTLEKSTGTKLSPMSDVSCRSIIVLFSALNSSGVVMSEPGAISFILVHTSGRVVTPMYCTFFRKLENSCCVFGCLSESHLSFWSVWIHPSDFICTRVPLKVTMNSLSISHGLHTKCLLVMFCFSKTSGVPTPNKPATCRTTNYF